MYLPNSLDSGVEEEDQRLDSALFYNWVNNKIGEFLEILKNDLARGASSFDTILSQCMYFGLSFSRVGTDFRPLMVPIILDAIRSKFEHHCLRAKDQLRTTLSQFSVSDIADATEMESAQNYESSGRNTSTILYPPIELSSIGPLALFCNNLSTALNELRVYCPISLAKSIGIYMQGLIHSVAEILNNWIDEHYAERVLASKEG